MRVGFFVNQFPSGSLTFVTSQITGLIDRGFEVHIIGQRPKQRTLVHDEVKRYRLLDRTHYWPPGGYRGWAAAGLVHARRALHTPRASHLNVRGVFQQLRSTGIKAAPRLFRKAATLAGLPHLDVLVSHFGPVGLEAQQLRDLKWLNAPMMTVFHGYDVSRWVDKHGAHAYDPLFQRCELLAPVSQYWAERLAQLGCPRERLRVTRMGVDCSRIEFRPRVAPASGTAQITTVARFTEKKGLEYALRALARVNERAVSNSNNASAPRFHYHLVGDGPLRPQLTTLITELGLNDVVTLHGWKTQTQVVELLDSTHLFLLPSVTAADGDQEGIPVSLMEAVAAGIPVISTKHTGIPELVRHGNGQLLVPERDSAALATAISALLDNPTSWPDIGLEGRRIVELEFNLETLNDELAATLTELARSGMASPADLNRN